MYSEASGGAIYVGSASARLTLADSRIIANRAVGVENGVAVGGGLSFNDVQIDLVNDTLQSNRAVGGSTVTNASFGQASGGAIAENEPNGQTMTVISTKFLNNQATAAIVNQTYARKGSNDASLGGAIVNEGADIQIIGGSFTGNRADGGTGVNGSEGANGEGGAIYSIGTAPYVTPNSSPQPASALPNAFVIVTAAVFQKTRPAAATAPRHDHHRQHLHGRRRQEEGAIDNDEYSELDTEFE